MQHTIKKYPVQNPLLRRYIKFFWELRISDTQLDHRLIPQRNINMRFNLSDTPHYISSGEKQEKLNDVYFLGLQSHFMNASLRLKGKVDVVGICFAPDGFYPFVKMPASEFKNQVLGADEIGLKVAGEINEKLKEAEDTNQRLAILEQDLLSLLNCDATGNDDFRPLFESLQLTACTSGLSNFCNSNNIGPRQLERLFNKNVGLPASTYITLNRFHKSLNQLLYTSYSKLSDLAYDNDFFDQMHFIKEFKRFAGSTPGKFIKNDNSILQIGKIR